MQEIPFQEYQEQNIIQFNQDDVYSDIINIPFSFDFYDFQSLTQLKISSNGYLKLSYLNSQNSNWQFSDAVPSSTLPNHAIYGVYHDMDNSVGGGAVYKGQSGSSPNRRFYVFYENMPHYSGPCNSLLSSTQIVLHEATGIIDVYIKDKPVCSGWNSGNALVGLQSTIGANNDVVGITPPNRNTGVWTAQLEGWRFVPATDFDVVVCDTNNDGSEDFDFDTYATTILSLFNLDAASATVSFFDTNSQAVSGMVALSSGANDFTIEVDVTGDVSTFNLSVSFIDCDLDAENDGLTNSEEDVNGNGDLSDDDTDGDGIPNYLDDDDDGDTVLTNVEIVFGVTRSTSATFLDTDGDNIPDHLDFDDDGDGVLTLDEDYNFNGDPTDDDVNNNGVPDYLDTQVLNIDAISVNTNLFSLFPNPATDKITIQFASTINFEDPQIDYKIYDYLGRQLSQSSKELFDNEAQIDVSNLSSGNYLLVINKDGIIKAKKFMVK